VALSQGSGISFAWRPDASAGVLMLEGVPSSGLVGDDGVLRLALCLAGDSLADASPSAVASALTCGSAACAVRSASAGSGWSDGSLDVGARLSERTAALAEAAQAAEEAAEAERLAAEQAAEAATEEVATSQAIAEGAEQVEAAQDTSAAQAATVDAPEPEVEAAPEGVVIQIDATTGEGPTDGRADAAPEDEPTAETATEAGDASGNDVGEPGDSDAPSPGDGTSQ
jgi:hypothetical protein